jgi:hypothetical protein
VRLYRREAEIEQRSDFLVRAPLREQLQHFLFAIRQQTIGIAQSALLQLANVVLNEHGRDGGTKIRLSSRNCANGRNEIFVSRALEKVRAGPGSQRPPSRASRCRDHQPATRASGTSVIGAGRGRRTTNVVPRLASRVIVIIP